MISLKSLLKNVRESKKSLHLKREWKHHWIQGTDSRIWCDDEKTITKSIERITYEVYKDP